MFVALQRAQAIMIFHPVITLSRGSSSFPHIITNAPLSLANSLIDLK